MSRVLLVNPQVGFAEPRSATGNSGWIRLGIAYLSSALKKHGHHAGLLDFRYLSNWEGIVTSIESFEPDVVSISAITYEKANAIHTAAVIKQNFPDIKIAVGGIHASIAPEDYERTGYFDCVIRGEGEVTLPKVVDSFYKKEPQKTVWGETPDLNEIPFPDRTLWHDYTDIINTKNHLQLKTPWVQMMVSRGCPYRCRFCCGPGEQNHFTSEGKDGRRPFIRWRSVENVIAELEYLDAHYHFKSIQYQDDQFILNPAWMRDFCWKLSEHGLANKNYWAASRADIILRNKKLIIEMRETGLDIMSVGFESFSNPLLKFWDKGVTAEQNYEAAKFLKDIGVKIFANIIFGAPREDGKWYIEDDIANVEAIRKIEPAMASRTMFNPIIGSELYGWCINRGLVNAQTGAHDSCIAGVDTRKVRLLMDEVYMDRPAYRRWYDMAMEKMNL